MHQTIEIECVIRRINNKKVWYLYSYELEQNCAKWTPNFHRAHLFSNELEANDFISVFLDDRATECDTFSEYESWTI